MDELRELFYEFGDLSTNIRTTNIDGLIVGHCLKDPIKFIFFIRQKLRDVPWEIRYLLRFIPIEKVVLTDILEIKDISIELMKKIPSDESLKIQIEKRHTNLKQTGYYKRNCSFYINKGGFNKSIMDPFNRDNRKILLEFL